MVPRRRSHAGARGSWRNHTGTCHTLYFSFLLPGRRLLVLVFWQDYLLSVPSHLLCLMCSNDICFLLWLDFFVEYVSDTSGLLAAAQMAAALGTSGDGAGQDLQPGTGSSAPPSRTGGMKLSSSPPQSPGSPPSPVGPLPSGSFRPSVAPSPPATAPPRPPASSDRRTVGGPVARRLTNGRGGIYLGGDRPFAAPKPSILTINVFKDDRLGLSSTDRQRM